MLARTARTHGWFVLSAICVLMAIVPAAARAAEFTVDSTADVVDANVGNGVCATTTGRCTLRAAIQEANMIPGADAVSVPGGLYTIRGSGTAIEPPDPPELPGVGFVFDPALFVDYEGDYDIAGPLTLTGAGAAETVIDGGVAPFGSPVEQSAADRLFEIHPHAGNVTIAGLTVREGYSTESGGAILNRSAGVVRLADMAVRDSATTDYGGGIYNAGPLDGICPTTCPIGDGRLELLRTTVSGNHTGGKGGGVFSTESTLVVRGTASAKAVFAGNTAAEGAAIYNGGEPSLTGSRARVDVVHATFSDGVALADGGAIYNEHEGDLSVADSTFADNLAWGDGGAVDSGSKTSASLTRSTFAGNRAGGDGGAVFTHGERPVSISDSTFTGNHAGVDLVDDLGQFHEGEGGGGAATLDGTGNVTILRSTFEENAAGTEGGALAIVANGTALVADSAFRRNESEVSGGAILNAGMRVTFRGLTVTHNKAFEAGGGIDNQGSGEFVIDDTTIATNTALDGGGIANRPDALSRIIDSTLWDNRARQHGGGFNHESDADTDIENTTISGNHALVGGGGIFVDADGGLRVISSTITENRSPQGSGVGKPIESINFPVVPSLAAIFRNTIVAGNRLSPDCNGAWASEGGNLDGGSDCYFAGPRDRTNVDPQLDALADHGGATMTHEPRPGSFAIDGGLNSVTVLVDGTTAACPETDQRGVSRPRNGRCDVGAHEYEGPFPPPDSTAPQTKIADDNPATTGEIARFRFSGTDNVTDPAELTFECRILNSDPTDPPEPVDPTEPPELDPELMWYGCASPWPGDLLQIEDGPNRLEVRAVDRAGNVDPTPDVHAFIGGEDFTPPQTFLTGTPPSVTSRNSAVFGFSATDDSTDISLIEYECRVDSGDWEAVECMNPMGFSNLSIGQHTFQVRAVDEGDNIDPTPASFTWTIAPATTCDEANITLGASADTWVDELEPLTNFGIDEQLTVRSGVFGENARALVRFTLPTELPDDCQLTSARLRLHSDGEAGRTLQALPIAEPWSETHVNWLTQPETGGTAATAPSGPGYREWDVTSHVAEMLAGGPGHGFLVRDAQEEDPEGADQAFSSRDTIAEPPEVPKLVLRFAGGSSTPPPAAPSEDLEPTRVECGQVLTESTLVLNDLTCDLGDALVIGAPDIVVDLGGHTIDGPDFLLIGQEDGLPAGIRNIGHENVVIRNGTVQEFGNGVSLMAGARFGVVQDLELKRNALAGVELWDADDGRNGSVVRGNTFSTNAAGVAILSGTDNALVADNRFDGDVGVAVHIVDSSGNRIERNEVTGVPIDPTLDSDAGILLESATDNVLLDNTLTESGDGGVILAAGSHRNRVEGNVMSRTGDAGVAVEDSDGNEIIGNLAHLASDAGVRLNAAHDGVVLDNDVRFNPSGVALEGSSGNRIEGNDANGSDGTGIAIGSGSLRNRVVDNDASNTRGDGIAVEGEALDLNGQPLGGNLVEGNRANGNLGDGIAAGAGHTLTGNAAHHNAAWGIQGAEAAPGEAGVVDGGGNTASGNGEPEQCSGVTCAPGTAPPLPPGPDVTAPDTLFTDKPADGASGATTQVFRFTGTDDVAPATALRFECRLDPPPDPTIPPEPPEPPEPGEPPEPVEPVTEHWEECASPVRFQYMLSGEHRFEVRATDPYDNFDLTPAVYTWNVSAAPAGPDSTAPRTTIVEGPSDPSTTRSATFRFRASDNTTPGPDLRYECRLDGAAFAPCSSPATYDGLPLGDHSFAVRALDYQGNRDASPASHEWTIKEPPADTNPPETEIESGPDPRTVETGASLTFSADEEGSTFECSLDGGAFTACESPREYGGLAVGDHTVRVRAVDPAGNLDATPASHAWTIGPPPVSRNVTCGTRLTESTRITNDLTDCGGDAIVVGAHGITIDLNGRAVDGVGVGAGVRNDGFDHVTITGGGTLHEFEDGVRLGAGTAHNIVTDISVLLNKDAGIQLNNADEGGAGNLVRGNTVTNNELSGIDVTGGTQHARVVDNTVGANAKVGVRIAGSRETRVEGNRITASSEAGLLLEGATDNTLAENVLTGNGGEPVAITLASNDNRLERNQVTANSKGVVILQSNGNELVGNVFNELSDTAIALEAAAGTLIRGNDIRFNSGGVDVYQSSRNRLEDNDVSENSSSGIWVGDLSYNNVIVRNDASSNSSSGIMVEVEAPAGSGTLVQGNTANGNDSSGIAVNKIGHTLVGNTANNNMAWGIYSSVATSMGMNVDGGGNRAVGNKELFQCFEVRCDGTPPVRETFPPETSISGGPSGSSAVDSASFTFSGADNSLMDVDFECRLDGGAFGPCVSPRSYNDLEPGAHVFEVRAIDPAGNVDPTPARRSWTHQPLPPGVPPETSIDAGPDTVTTSTSATFRVGSDEPAVSFECALDGAAFTACESPTEYAGLALGSHELRVRATDGEGNTDSSPATHAWRIAPPPQPAAVSCGQVLTESVRLTNSLTDCPGDGLVVGAHAITIDLGGQTIDGAGAGAGIRNSRFDDVTITNGVVQEFQAGVDVGPSARNVVSSLTVQLQLETGIRLSGTAGASVRSNTVTTGLADAVALVGGTRTTLVRDNTVSGNLGRGVWLENAAANRIEENSVIASEGMAIALEGSVDNVLERNTLTGNAGGIDVALLSHGARVERNTVTAGEGGIQIVESNGARVLENVVEQAAAGALVMDSAGEAVVRGNDLRFNAGGIELSDSSGARIEENAASATAGTGLAIDGASLNNEVVDNAFDANEGGGIAVEAVAPAGEGTLIDRNSAMGNGDDGIYVAGSGHTIVTNVAHMNDGWGMYVEPGNVDGGGNLAAGNVEPLQCFGIACEDGGFVPPGLPDTTLLDRPSDPSQSRNASFTFVGSDDTTALIDLEFQCRLDSTSELDWEDCENPQQYTNLAPGRHVFEVRAIDIAEFVDPTPARYEWTYEPMPPGVAPDTMIEHGPPASTPALESVFQFSADEPDVTFECRMDAGAWEPCANDPEMVAAGIYAHIHEFEDFQVGPHRFEVRARDIEGNLDPTPAVHEWRISGLLATILSGPAFEPGENGEPASGGETESTTATFDFVANAAEAAFECSLDMAPFAPCEAPVTYTGLAVGDHIFRVSATDLDGQLAEEEPAEYEWTVLPSTDTTPPETTINMRPADGSSDTTFTFTATDDQSPLAAMDFECRLDSTDELAWYGCRGEGPVGGEYTHNLLDEFPDLAPGTHTFEVRAIDDPETTSGSTMEGNADPTPATYTWTSVADTTAPETTLFVVPASPTIETEASFEFTGADNATPELLLGFECSLDGAPFEACDSPHDFSSLEPGEHTLRVRAVDLGLNPDPTPAAHSWTVIGPPETLIAEAPAALTSETAATFRFSSDQPDVTFECSFGGAAMEPCSSPVTYDLGGGGQYAFEVQATNAYGLVDETPARHEWTVEAVADTEPPDTTILGGREPVTTSFDATFTFSASQAGSTFECQLDGRGFGDCSTPHALTGLDAGEHLFEVRAVDPSGNVDPTPAALAWTVDGPPLTEILSGPAEEAESTTATFTFASSDPGSTFECWLDGDVQPCSEPGITYTDLAVGEHIFAVRATDAGGQLELEWQEWEWEVVPVTAPETTLGDGPGAATVSREAMFAFASNEEGSTFECSLDGAPFDACVAPAMYDGLVAGEHAFEVRATDQFGNVDPTPARYEWSVLAAAQLDTSITAGPPARTIETDAGFSFSVNATGAAFECSLDGAAFEACEPPVQYSGLQPGAHVLEVRALDAEGSAEATPARREWTVVGAPVTTFDVAPAATTTDPDARFEFSADQADVTFLCSLDGAEPEPCTSPVQYVDVGGGAHTFEVEATNEFGLVEEPPALHEWTIDGPAESTPPATTITSAPPAQTASPEAAFEFAGSDNRTSALELGFECSLDGAAFASCSSPHAVQDLAAGEHTLRVRAVDEAGNADPTPAEHAWTVLDVTAPETTIDAGPEDPTQATGATFEFSADEAGVTFECSVDGGSFESCGSPHELTGLALGSHAFAVRARDASGNADTTPDVHQWTVEAPPDTTPPVTTAVSGPPATTPETTASFSFSADEAVDGFECSLDGAAFASCDSPHVVDGVAVGEHTMRVRATDLAGNIDPTPVVFTWSVLDSTPPDTEITGGPTGSTTSSGASFTFTATEAGSTFECSLDGTAFTACTSPQAYSGLSAAAHEVRVRAKDAAGNLDPTPAARAWTVTAAPSCSGSTSTLGAAADSWMLQSSSSQNYGADSVLKVDSKNGANARAVVRFNLPAIPAGCQVTGARLRLYASSYKTGRTLQALRLGATWAEGTIRWSTQPATSGAAATTTSGSGYREWTVTSQVQGMYTGGNHGFLIRDATENASGIEQGFNSREKGSDNPPRLVLTFG